jgi:hypothetical protein
MPHCASRSGRSTRRDARRDFQVLVRARRDDRGAARKIQLKKYSEKPSTVTEPLKPRSAAAVAVRNDCCRHSPIAGESLAAQHEPDTSRLRWRGSGKIQKSNSRMAQPNSASRPGMMDEVIGGAVIELAHRITARLRGGRVQGSVEGECQCLSDEGAVRSAHKRPRAVPVRPAAR